MLNDNDSEDSYEGLQGIESSEDLENPAAYYSPMAEHSSLRSTDISQHSKSTVKRAISHNRSTNQHGNIAVNRAIAMKFVHDEETHIDDLDITFNSIETHVTSTSLRDSYDATNRVLEAIKIMTGEMERRVHEFGRNFRRESQRKVLLCFHKKNHYL